MEKHVCGSCKQPISYGTRESIYCSNCGKKNKRYITALGDGSLDSKITKRLRDVFENDGRYIYLLGDKYNGVGEVFKSIIRIDTTKTTSHYWVSSKEVAVKFHTDFFSITKTFNKGHRGKFSIATNSFPQYSISLEDLFDTTKNSTMRKRLLNGLMAFPDETTKDVYDYWKAIQKQIEEVLEVIQPHPKQILPKDGK